MKPAKYTKKQTSKIDLGGKVIFKYPTPTKKMDIARMVIKGRHPENKNSFMLGHVCNFVIYVIKGRGKIYAGDEVFKIEVGDVVFVPAKNKYAVEGNMEYITVDSPAFYQEQYEQIEVK